MRRCPGRVLPLLLGLGLPAQIVVVDPNGGGNYRELQTAIDAVSAGTVIRVLGGSYGPLKITKSLTILCDPAAVVTQPYTGRFKQPDAVTLAGSGSDRLILSGFTIKNLCNGASWNSAGAGIGGSGFAEVSVVHSQVHGAEWQILTGDAMGAPALMVSGANRVFVADCTLQGSASWRDNLNTFGPDGPEGMLAPGADVVVQRSTVRGGDGGDGEFYYPPYPHLCPCPGSGRGGDGVSAGRVFHSGATIEGGKGGVVRVGTSPHQYRPWGKQPDGQPIVASLDRALPAFISQTTRMQLGKSWQLTWGYHGGGGILLISIPVATPLEIAGQWLFVDPNTLFAIGFTSSQGSITLPVPLQTTLAGTPIVAQVLDHSATVLTGPAFDVIDF